MVDLLITILIAVVVYVLIIAIAHAPGFALIAALVIIIVGLARLGHGVYRG